VHVLALQNGQSTDREAVARGTHLGIGEDLNSTIVILHLLHLGKLLNICIPVLLTINGIIPRKGSITIHVVKIKYDVLNMQHCLA
jgi:hypothetical protein